MQPEKSPIKISIGTDVFELSTIDEAVALLRGIKHATPIRRRRVKTVTPKTGAKPNV